MDIETDDDDARQRLTGRVVIGFGITFKIIVLVFMTVAFVKAEDIGTTFDGIVERGCTDAASATLGFNTIGGTIDDVQANSVGNITIEVLMIVYSFYSIYAAKAFNKNDIYKKNEVDIDMDSAVRGAVGPQNASAITMDPSPPPPPPPPADGGWTRYEADNGRPYWARTGQFGPETTWEDPHGGGEAA